MKLSSHKVSVYSSRNKVWFLKFLKSRYRRHWTHFVPSVRLCSCTHTYSTGNLGHMHVFRLERNWSAWRKYIRDNMQLLSWKILILNTQHTTVNFNHAIEELVWVSLTTSKPEVTMSDFNLWPFYSLLALWHLLPLTAKNPVSSVKQWVAAEMC